MSAATENQTMLAPKSANVTSHSASMLQNLLRLIQAGEPDSVVMACNVFQVRQLGQLWWLYQLLVHDRGAMPATGSSAAACHAGRSLARELAGAHPADISGAG